MSAPTTTREEPREAGWTASLKDRSGAVRRRTKDWLDRPMTSFHLLLAVFFLLLGVGLLMVLSSSSVTAYRKDGSSFSFFKKQLLFAGVGMVGFYIMMRMKIGWLRSISTGGVIASLGLLVIVLGMPKVNGAHSWIFITSSLGFQPSEFAKFAMVIWGGHVLASRRANLGSWKELLVPVLPVAALMGFLIFREPDLGMTATLFVIVFALFFFAGASLKMYALLGAVGIAGVISLALSAGYRHARVISFLDPEADPQGAGMQLLQGLYGMADGGWFGVGLGQSRAKWAYLPHAESDFIFAIIGEELGFIGAGLVVLLYITLALVGLRIARRNVDPFIKLVAATSTAWLVGQAAINIFYVVGLLPVTGLTLPMISAGGTSLIVTMAIFGLLANFARREPQAMAALQNSGPGPISRFFGIGVPSAGLEDSKKAAERAERRTNRQWAKAASRKAQDEKRTLRAVARQRPLDRRDEPRQQPDRARLARDAAGRPVDDSSASRTTRIQRPAHSGERLAGGSHPLPSPQASRGGVAGWLGFGQAGPPLREGAASASGPEGRPERSAPRQDRPGGQRSSGGRPAAREGANRPASSPVGRPLERPPAMPSRAGSLAPSVHPRPENDRAPGPSRPAGGSTRTRPKQGSGGVRGWLGFGRDSS